MYVCKYVCPLFLLQLYDDECMLLRFLILIHSLYYTHILIPPYSSHAHTHTHTHTLTHR